VRGVVLVGLALLLLGCPGSRILCVEVLDTSARHLTFRTTAKGDCPRNPRVTAIDVSVAGVGGWGARASSPRALLSAVTYGVAPPGFETSPFGDGTMAHKLQAGMRVRIRISGPHVVGGTEVTLTE
jgi:hypothetical protein